MIYVYVEKKSEGERGRNRSGVEFGKSANRH